MDLKSIKKTNYHMGRIITFYNSKGGTGKTTFNIITSCVIHNYTSASVCLIEGDPQEDVINKHKTSLQELEDIENKEGIKLPSLDVISVQWPKEKNQTDLYMAAVLDAIESVKDKYDYVFVNLWGILHAKGMGNVLAVTNHFFIPIEADEETVISAIKLMNVLQTIQKSKGSDIRSFHLFKNRVSKNKMSQEWRDLDGYLESQNYPVMNNYIKDSVSMNRAKGNTIVPIELNDHLPPIKQQGSFYPFFVELMNIIKEN